MVKEYLLRSSKSLTVGSADILCVMSLSRKLRVMGVFFGINVDVIRTIENGRGCRSREGRGFYT